MPADDFNQGERELHYITMKSEQEHFAPVAAGSHGRDLWCLLDMQSEKKLSLFY